MRFSSEKKIKASQIRSPNSNSREKIVAKTKKKTKNQKIIRQNMGNNKKAQIHN